MRGRYAHINEVSIKVSIEEFIEVASPEVVAVHAAEKVQGAQVPPSLIGQTDN